MSTLSTVQNVYVPNFMDLTLENALDSGWIALLVPKVKSVKILSAILPDSPLQFTTATPFNFTPFLLIRTTVRREVDL